jgi:hypothetical protein
MRIQDACVLHVAGVGDDEALETLCRTTHVIAALGVEQLLLVLEDGRGTDLLWSAALPVQVRPLRLAGLSMFAKVAALRSELATLSRELVLYAVHLHGMAPCLLGAGALMRSPLPVRVLYSPHLALAAAPWSSALLKRLLQVPLEPHDYVAVTASLTEAQALSQLLNRSAEVLPEHVSAMFFELERREAGQPRVVVDGSGAQAVNAVARLSVLLNGRSPRVRIAWLGAATLAVRAKFDAASVEVLDLADETERARSLSHAWAYLHLAANGRVPRGVAQAMAAGVPCLVSDTPAHRALIRHGETGFVCTSERDLLEKLIGLLRDPVDRARIGNAARADALGRFTSTHFERAILRAYGLAASVGAPVQPALGMAVNGERQASWNSSAN